MSVLCAEYPSVNASLCSRCFPDLHLESCIDCRVQASSITQPLAQCCNNAGNTVTNPVLANLTSRSKNDLKEKHMLLEALRNWEALCGSKCKAKMLTVAVLKCFLRTPVHHKNSEVSKSFHLYWFYPLIFTILEIKTENIFKIFINSLEIIIISPLTCYMPLMKNNYFLK